MSTKNLPEDYFEFQIDVMNLLHDSQAVLDLVLNSEDPELETSHHRAVVMAYERITGALDLLDGSFVKYSAKSAV